MTRDANAWRTAFTVFCVGATALTLAFFARHQLIEPADMTAFCDGGAQTTWCSIRAWIIQGFVHRRIGWFALALAALATVTGWRIVAGATLFCACVGLVLYTAELCAPAALLALLVFVRERQSDTPANVSHSPHNAQA